MDAPAQSPGKDVSPGTKDDAEKRTDGRVGKRRAKENADGTPPKSKDDLRVNLPSVPSTQHLSPSGEKTFECGILCALLIFLRCQCRIPVLSPSTFVSRGLIPSDYYS
jgi:hypothetical protein